MTEFPSHQASEREEVARRLAKFATFIAEQVTGKTHLVVSADPVVQTETDLILALQAEGRRELVERLTRPLISLENRTPLEVFDIMSDRIRSALSKASGGGGKQELSSARRSEDRGCADPREVQPEALLDKISGRFGKRCVRLEVPGAVNGVWTVAVRFADGMGVTVEAPDIDTAWLGLWEEAAVQNPPVSPPNGAAKGAG